MPRYDIEVRSSARRIVGDLDGCEAVLIRSKHFANVNQGDAAGRQEGDQLSPAKSEWCDPRSWVCLMKECLINCNSGKSRAPLLPQCEYQYGVYLRPSLFAGLGKSSV